MCLSERFKDCYSGIFPFQDLISLTNLIFVLFSCEPCGLCDDGKLKTFHFILLVSLCVLCLVGVPFFLFVFFILPGKREASPMSQEQAPKKKPKTEDNIVSKSSPIASLVAYGEDDSSDEEGSASPETKQMSSRQPDNGDSRRGGNLPFWAVRR